MGKLIHNYTFFKFERPLLWLFYITLNWSDNHHEHDCAHCLADSSSSWDHNYHYLIGWIRQQDSWDCGCDYLQTVIRGSKNIYQSKILELRYWFLMLLAWRFVQVLWDRMVFEENKLSYLIFWTNHHARSIFQVSNSSYLFF